MILPTNFLKYVHSPLWSPELKREVYYLRDYWQFNKLGWWNFCWNGLRNGKATSNLHFWKIGVEVENYIQKQPPRGNPRKSCSENLQQIYRRTPPIALRHGCSPVNLLHIFRTAFPRNTSGWLLLDITELTPIKYDESESHTFEHLYILKGNHFLMSPTFIKAM